MKFFLKKTSFLAIILLIIANFLLGNIVLAKGIKITDKDMGKIKTGLSLMKALVNYTIGDNTLKTALNMTIGGGEIGADITYGLIVLTAINEMDFIDMVVSQRYKQEATAYFDQVINERTNLMSYWKGVGYDLPRVAMGYVTSPIAGLTLNSFSITDKIISIFTAFKVIKQEKLYDGLWYYFSLRRENKMPHDGAWEDAKILMGWAVKPNPYLPSKLDKSNNSQLESQFAALWDKWGAYTDSKGVTEMAKEQFREEMGQIVAGAIEKQALAEKSKELSLLSKAVEASKNFIKETAKTIKNTAVDVFNTIKSAVSQINPFGAEVSQPLSSFTLEDEEIEEVESLAEVGPLQSSSEENKEGVGGPRPLDDAQNQLDDIAERIDVLDAETAKLITRATAKGEDEDLSSSPKEKDVKEEKKENELTEEEETKKEEEIIEESEEELEEATDELEVGQNIGQKLCEKITGVQPLRNKVIFNEIAWMGGINSSNDEWIEMRNISGSEIDLAGWQILSKSDNIKIVFSGGQTSANAVQPRVLSGGFFLLERTGDDSAPGVRADFIYTGALKNSEETIYLFDENCWFQDIVAAGSDWPAGDNSSKRTMERRQDFGWQTSVNAGGTPKTGNSSGYFVFSGGGGVTPPPSPPPPPPYQKILISEIQITGQNSEKDDFVELYNPNNEDIGLTDWYIQRKTESASDFSTYAKKDLFSGKEILAKDYFLVANASSSFSADILTTYPLTEDNTLALKNPNQEIVDKVGWGNAQDFETATATSPQEGQSIGRKWSTSTESYIDTDNNQTDFEVQNPTPKVQNQSPEPPPPTEEPLLSVVINEIAWMGTNATDSSDEWIELYNNSSSTIDLNNWTLTWSHGTSTHSITFSASDAATTTILGYNFYLMERTNDQTISDISADQIYTGALENEGEKLELRDAQNNLIDLVDCSSGWFSRSSSPDYISMERINPNSTGTVAENWLSNNLITRNGTDAAGNPINGTPKAQNSAYLSLPPNPVSDLSIDSENSFANKVVLFWSSSTDTDTLSENLSYEIYYSKEGEITEGNLTASTTLSAATSAASVLISDLYYNSTYYFGVKVFDGQNYSVLSNIVSYQTPTLSTVASNFPANLEIKNNGRKISRVSNGDFYVVYSRDGKIFLARSADQGKNWTEINVTREEELEQINPSIAIDSQNNLHLVWQGKATTSAPYQIRYRKYDGNSFSAIEDLTNNSEWNQEIPVIAIDSNNNVHLVWVNNRQRICSPQGDCYSAPQILYQAFVFVNNEWGTTETTGNFAEFVIYSLTLTVDSSGDIHLVWQAGLRSGPSWHTAILYQKRTDTWGATREIDKDSLQGEQSSIAVDSNNNIHIVWRSTGSYSDPPNNAYYYSYIKYSKYEQSTGNWSEVSKLETNERNLLRYPSLSLDSNGNIYGISVLELSSGDEIHQIKYSDGWKPIEVLLTTNRQNYLKQPNLLWSFYPVVEGKKTNQPKTGFVFIFYEGTELKFYASQDLTWE